MIVVIADDLTGAGEIAGLGLAYGLKAEIQRKFSSDSNARLLIIDTDTRSLSPQDAQRVIRDVARRLKKSSLPIEWIYKKTDSVLRGPVVSELEALREVMNVVGIMLVPANPSKGRIVRNGHYFINGKPLSETEFAGDPEYPARTSNVLELTGLSGSGQANLLECDQPFLCEGIVIGQTETTDELSQWAKRVDEQTIMSGAGEFFEAILRNKGLSKQKSPGEYGYCLENKVLFVCGSSSDSSRQALTQAENFGMRICRMPEGLFRSMDAESKFFQQWYDEITGCLENNCSVIIAIGHEVVKNAEFAGKLRNCVATIVTAVLRKIPLKELFVEGGATASAIVGHFGWNRFEPFDQLAPGVVRMKVLECDNICLTIKPGSYPWPENIWKKEVLKAE